MARLQCVVFADPSRAAAEHLAELCERLAVKRLVTTTGEDTLRAVVEHNPQMLVLSLDLKHPEAQDVVSKLTKSHPDVLLVGTFRELSVPAMEKLGRVGVEEFLPQPVDLALLFRTASTRFNLPLRRHDRFEATIDLLRADGVLIGKSLDISLGGLRLSAIHPVSSDESLLLSLALNDGKEPLRVRCLFLAVEGTPPQPVTARVMFSNLRGEDYRRLASYLASIDKKPQES